MTIRKSHSLTLAVAVLAACLCSSLVQAADDQRSLVRAVPDDVFLCISAQHNPERDFLNSYWGEVIDTLLDTGLGDDVLKLLTANMDEDTHAQFDRLRSRASELFHNVNWEALVSRQMVFAERFPDPTTQTQPIIGPPEMLFLSELKPAQAQHNYTGLTRILSTLADEVNNATGKQILLLRQSQMHGTEATVLTIEDLPPQAPQIRLGVARRNNVLIIAFGPSLFEQSLALLAGETSIPSMIDNPRYQAAFSRLPAAEDSQTFFDLQAMLVPYRHLAHELPKLAARGGPEDIVLNATHSGPAHELNAKSWQAYQQGDYQRGLKLIQQAHELAPADTRILYNLACYHALTGNQERALDFLKQAVAGGFYSPNHIRHDPDLETLRDDPRYDAAVKLAQERAAAAATRESNDWARGLSAVSERLLDAVSIIDYIAAVEQTDEYTVRVETLTVLVPDAHQRPIYPALAANEQMTDYIRFLPQETKSFSAATGPDLPAMHQFLLDTFREFGPKGDAILTQWESIQQQIGFNLQDDVLAWLDGDSISVTLADSNEWVWFVKVTNEDLARDKMSAAVRFCTDKLRELATEVPALNMLAAVAMPLDDERLPDFQSLRFTMVPQPFVWGVSDGYLIVGASADAVALCLDTAAGKHPGVHSNQRVMAEALLPDQPLSNVSLTDLRGLGTELSEVIGAITMASGMAGTFIPEPEARQILLRLSGMLSRLVPVVQKIDFFKSSASYTTFDGQAWHTHTATHYFAPHERGSSTTAAR